MPQARITLSFFLLVLWHCTLLAQFNPYGSPPIENYAYLETGGGEQNWCITQDHRGLIYVSNDENGILEFDGTSWRTIPGTEGRRARSLVTGEDGVIYAGLDGDFGWLEPGMGGSLHFKSLADSTIGAQFENLTIWRTYFGNQKVYFCGTKAIIVLDPSSGDLEVLENTEYGFISFLIGKDLISSDFGIGLTRYEGNAFIPIPGGEFFKEKTVFDAIPLDSTRLLVGTYDKGLMLFDLQDGTVDTTYLEGPLKEELIAAKVLNLATFEEYVFVGTQSGGLYVLDRQGRLQETISPRQGLLSETVAYVYTAPGAQGSCTIWVAHFQGISRIEINNPFRITTLGRSRMDLAGGGSGEQIYDLVEFNNALIISTQSGLFRRDTGPGMSRMSRYREIREPIHDLQVFKPSPGLEFLLASGEEQIYVIGRNNEISMISETGRNLLWDPVQPDIFYAGSRSFKGFQYRNGKWEKLIEIQVEGGVRHMCMDKHSSVWISTFSGLVRLDSLRSVRGPQVLADLERGLPDAGSNFLFTDPESGELLVGSTKGFYRFDPARDSMVFDSAFNSILPEGNNHIISLHLSADGMYWFSFENEFSGWRILGGRRNESGFQLVHDRPFRALPSHLSTPVFCTDSENKLWFARSNELYHFDASLASEEKDVFPILMRQVRLPGDSLLFNGTHYRTGSDGRPLIQADQRAEDIPEIDHKYRDIEFSWASPYYKNRWQIRYAYFLEGFSSNWSNWEPGRSAKFTNLPHGHYTMQVKATNVYGEESPVTGFSFIILRPWYATIAAISLYLILLASLILTVVFYTRNLRRRAEVLERKNREIELQKNELEHLNEEITAQRDEIETQRDSIAAQKELIDQQKTAMTDSIIYAKRIQDAVLPAKEVMRFLLPKHFVFYRPRDIVSGDFYWVNKKDELILLAVADCTGHGVPGAFMSMLGISLLNEIASKYSDRPINEIMDELRDRVIASLGQTGDRYETRDGIEMGLLAIDPESREIQYTGASMDLYTFQKGEFVLVKGDRMPVGIHSEGNTFFSVQKLKLTRGDTLYLFSDGYPDQFGGKERKKYGTARLKKLLAGVQQSIMHDQKAAVAQEFEQWKGQENQIDDVLMIGIKL